MDEQDPKRRDMQPPIPTHPPDPAAAGDADKVAGPAGAVRSGPAAPGGTGLGSGPAIDNAGGAGLGTAPGETSGAHTPAGQRDQDTRADDLQDRRGKG
ncbi:hypothetical protein [Massilia pseudoviolaceinigra]|uniref:hypothetical protein n=1 Tax=Massilia pseudoviolaceinigra TaxID=3057165 RepID=UPI0027969D2B|nr:hypothetical protein [Massilia sp. CCM 9206]MDQ1924329.1 hypothetical protein [Massilia sp. CCM 9206]